MDEAPKFETRAEQAYVGKRVVMPMTDFGDAIPALTAELARWLDQKGVKPAGKSFLRYHVVDMPDRMDVEVGFPVDATPAADADVSTGTLPAGRYVSLTFTGVENGIASNRRLIEWIGEQHKEPDAHRSGNGEAFAGRLETVLTDPEAEPDQSKWQTEVAIKIRDD